jgi:hypothetical protein
MKILIEALTLKVMRLINDKEMNLGANGSGVGEY